jgi:hypothetical protein
MTAASVRPGELSSEWRRPEEVALLALELSTGIAAVGGAWYGLAGARAVPVDWLEGTPFRDYRVPSAILGTAVGGSMLTAAASLLRQGRRRHELSTIAGTVLLGWIGTQVAMIGWRSPLQPAYLGVGIATLALARRLP